MCTRPYLGLSQAINFFFDQRIVFHFLIIRGETDTQILNCFGTTLTKRFLSTITKLSQPSVGSRLSLSLIACCSLA